ncbi:hypothetical protein [Polluticoccus soli]|uniref:hypothetical protein n=1 Tax=Polluticoccus soli TaxID=3034150 RepID=UPI0023E1C7B8|nr:hypothetical protein [Flavipsychrobacter sp. JY13-12]
MLELFLYRGQYQLGTYDALYSDGARYVPLVTAFKELKPKLPAVHEVLVLGTGLASAVQILDKKGFHPAFTLVENDVTVLNWAMELLPDKLKENIKPVCEDAELYMQQQSNSYDLLVVDVFINRVVPPFVTAIPFLNKCRRSINPGGHFVLNYIVNSNEEWKLASANINEVFPSSHVIDRGINKIVIAPV